jgi:cation diffusion facilitator CzcD-associated flavoprotein CzcO
METEFQSYLDDVRDPELKKKLTPDYHLGCTRIPKSDQNYYEAVQLPNVQVVKGAVARIHPDGVEMEDGTRYRFDVLVYATGFDSHAYMRPMTVTGLNGLTIDEAWKDDIYSFAGIGLPGFPNMFLLYGPFAPLNNIPVPLGLEQEIGYIMQAIEVARTRGVALSPTKAATDAFRERMREAFPGTVWVGCQNWYIDSKGTPILWPLPQPEHAKLLETLREEDMDIVPARQAG